ncbi:MBL fold metallo-hydrolase [Butyrivibrio sp. INlla16]|uniref:MBL fold metallo-hydrolase n=1 Tax=Butyrivibrio sp. INlla16 TaxID=1520807 RepID=UPI00088AB499|nr:MBL fold metallo-hydrolase [Butyrivibrio sp. INlla16]SDB26434.1 Metallo-beta-lactamase superfamily protein [Butyrivibrio sp. INlla16]
MIKTTKISEKIYILEDRFESGTSLIIGSEKALLFDTGCGVDDIHAEVRKITDLPLLVICSHGHFDHIGGSRFFTKVYLSKKDRNILDTYNEKLLNKWVSEMEDNIQDDTQGIVFGCGDWKQIAELDFDRIDLGDIHGEIIDLPGHSHGSIGILLPELKLLLSGDALSPIISLIFKNHGTVEEELQTVKKALELDFDYYISSHNGNLLTKDVLKRMTECLKDTENKRFYKYSYPKPPYGEGYFRVHSLGDEPVGLIVEKHM